MFGRRKKVKQPNRTVEPINLDLLIANLGQAIDFWQFQPQPQLLTRARYADCCRNCELAPVNETTFESVWKNFDENSQQRFSLVLSGFELESPQAALRQIGDAQKGLNRIVELAADHKQLTLDVIEKSDVRLEELARHFCAKWQLPIEDESETASAQRLHEIDFGRLMREADAAKSSAEDRLAYLRKLQEEQEETRRPRRGKW